MSGERAAKRPASMAEAQDLPIAHESKTDDQQNPHHGAGQPIRLDESELLYHESNIPKWRFLFLCVG